MKRKLRAILMIVLIVVFIISTTLLIRQIVDNKRSEDIYDKALDIALGVEDAEAEELADALPQTTWIPAPVVDDPVVEKMMDINLETLRKYNAEVVGWIRIPDTEVDYPLMQGEDNEAYLKRAWDGSDSFSGSIFLECMNTADLTDYNTIVYGHNMRNGSMFAALRMYKDAKFMEGAPYVYILTDAGVYRYEIFAAYDAGIESPTYGLSFNQTQTKINFLDHALESSVVKSGIEPAMTDRILTLSTCTNTGYSSRWVVQARLEMTEALLDEMQ